MPIASYLKAFADLPDLQHPAPPSTSDEENIGVIPIFSDVYLDIDNCIAFAKAACYSRHTALLNTDARNYLPIKFYVEDILRESVLPVFRENGVSEEDILWFNAPPLPDTHAGVWGRLGKKLSLYWDPRFADFSAVIYWDADLFFTANRHVMFQAFCDAGPNLHFIRAVRLQRRIWRPQTIRNSVKNVRYGKMPIQEIFMRAGLGRTLQTLKGSIVKPIGGLGIFPAQRFHREEKDFLEWLKEHGPYIGDDEIALMLGAALFDLIVISIEKVKNYPRAVR
ncbi:MAG: hypothetical protein OXN27_23360 [Candidatus Poribacteria bacterium]|nr:hypothetical protein [Candidatus Poribacteria bacterium]